jgi:hypothetical protein
MRDVKTNTLFKQEPIEFKINQTEMMFLMGLVQVSWDGPEYSPKVQAMFKDVLERMKHEWQQSHLVGA